MMKRFQKNNVISDSEEESDPVNETIDESQNSTQDLSELDGSTYLDDTHISETNQRRSSLVYNSDQHSVSGAQSRSHDSSGTSKTRSYADSKEISINNKNCPANIKEVTVPDDLMTDDEDSDGAYFVPDLSSKGREVASQMDKKVNAPADYVDTTDEEAESSLISSFDSASEVDESVNEIDSSLPICQPSKNRNHPVSSAFLPAAMETSPAMNKAKPRSYASGESKGSEAVEILDGDASMISSFDSASDLEEPVPKITPHTKQSRDVPSYRATLPLHMQPVSAMDISPAKPNVSRAGSDAESSVNEATSILSDRPSKASEVRGNYSAADSFKSASSQKPKVFSSLPTAMETSPITGKVSQLKPKRDAYLPQPLFDTKSRMGETAVDRKGIPPLDEPSRPGLQHKKHHIPSALIHTAMETSPIANKILARADTFKEPEVDLDESIKVLNDTFDKPTVDAPASFDRPLARSTLLPSDIHPSVAATKMLPVPLSLLQNNRKAVLGPESASSSVSSTDSDIIIDGTGSEGTSETSPPLRNGIRRGAGVIEESDPSSGVSLSKPIELDGVQSPMTNALGGSNHTEGSSAGSSHSSASDSQSERQLLKKQVEEKSLALRNLSFALKNVNTNKLKDGGKLLREKKEQCQRELMELKKKYEELCTNGSDIEIIEVKRDIVFSTRDQKIGDMGKKALETHRVEKALTMDALVNLHSGLASTPSAEVMEEQPTGLSSELMPHQRQALAWLLHREKQTPAGGILADDMGLGKTLTMISLVLRKKEAGRGDDDDSEKTSGWKPAGSGPGHPGKTLVVCPASLIAQWAEQVTKHVRRGRLQTLMHHGSNREGRGRMLTNADIVITTYGVVSQENKTKGALFRVAWERVILDEAHTIRNHKTQVAVAACELEAKYRWCLTGTPVHNKELDMYSLLKFLKCEPFDDLAVWKRWVDNKTAAGTERLNTVVKAILLRRTKEELKSAGSLKGTLSSKESHRICVTLDELEFAAYQCVMTHSMTLVAQYLQQRAEKVSGALTEQGIQRIKSQLSHGTEIQTTDILVLLLRLRQICCLPGLISAMLSESDTEVDGFEKEDKVVEDLFKQVRRLTISAPPPEETVREPLDITNVLVTSNPVFNIQRPSSKMRKVAEIVQGIVEMEEKVVVVSQWASFLRYLETHLKTLKVKMAILDGSVPVKSRGPLVEAFNDPQSSLKILLLSLTAGGVGLNLVGGNHLIIMEPHWNPQLESQACDRIYRVGQMKVVHIYKIICNETIEERIEALQKKKLELAETVLSGQLNKEAVKLSLQDIKSLFGLSPT